MRANPEEGRDAHSHGTFLNGFHETWHIHHAEEAFGFAKTGQTIVNVPDAKLMKLYVDDEPLLLRSADLEAYERVLDFRDGTLTRDLVWRTPGRQAGARALAAARQPGPPPPGDAHVRGDAARRARRRSSSRRSCSTARTARTSTTSPPPRSARAATRARCARSTTACSMPRLHREHDGEVVLGYRCANSGMTLACGYRHLVETPAPAPVETTRRRRTWPRRSSRPRCRPARRSASSSSSSYHTSTGVPAEELADRCHRTLDRAVDDGAGRDPRRAARVARRASGSDSDVELRGDDAGPAGDALEPVPARPGQRPDPGAGHRRQGRHRRRLRGPLLLGHRDLRRAVPRLHRARRRPASCCGSAGTCWPRPASGPSS